MILNLRIRNWFILLVTLFSSAFIIAGLDVYPGSKLIYAQFSFAFFFLLADGVFFRISLGYTFLAIFLWLGFWLKLTAHLLLDYPYLEPIGYFESNGSAWDSVLTVSIIGVLGVLVSRLLLRKLGKKDSLVRLEVHPIPAWYCSVRPWLWAGVWAVMIILPSINLLYGIFQVGLNPSLTLPWPLNGLTSWALSFGLAAFVATMVYWDYALGRGWQIGLLSTLAEGYLSSISILSRAGYLFHTLPYLIVLYVKQISKKQPSLKIMGAILATWLLFFAANLFLVTVLRYSTSSFIDASSSRSSLTSVDVTKKVSVLIIDRWVGLEGVMAVTAYPNKSLTLFYDALREWRVKGELDLFTREISRAQVSGDDIKKYQYGNIPGAIAFFFYSNSLWCVFLGMAGLTSLMILSEQAAFYLTKNPYLCAFWSMLVAQAVASFGLGVGQQVVYFITCFAALFLIWAVQKSFHNLKA